MLPPNFSVGAKGLHFHYNPYDLGAFALNIDYEQLTLELTSPKSGTFTYIYCLEKERWRGKDDGHDLKGMLVRDIIPLCNGVPDL